MKAKKDTAAAATNAGGGCGGGAYTVDQVGDES